MAEAGDQDFLSIGEVLGLLLEEFPDVTISKIRFLESQGLIDPERTPSGYRKFYEADVELLRVILREQRENYLPLRVIKDRIETGVIDPSGELPKPKPPIDGAEAHSAPGGASATTLTVEVPPASVAQHPAAHRDAAAGGHRTAAANGPANASDGPSATAHHGTPAPDAPDAASSTSSTRSASSTSSDQSTPATPRLLPGVLLDRSELCSLVGLRPDQLDELERYGVLHGRGSGAGTVYGDDAVEIAGVAVELLRAGLDARHLRAFRTAAEREVSLYEQLVTPRLRQRSPSARAEALESLRELDELGARLRAALTRTALRHHFDT